MEQDEAPVSRGLADKFFGKSLIKNLIIVFLVLTVFFIAVLLILCCKYVVLKRCPGCCKAILRKVESKLFWNSVLRAMLETYLATSISFFFAYKSIDSRG